MVGAVITGTHGGGPRQPLMTKFVTGLELITGEGEHLKLTRDNTPDFQRYLLTFGGLGVITRMTMRIEPTYMVHKMIYTNMKWDTIFQDDNFKEIMNYSEFLSFFI